MTETLYTLPLPFLSLDVLAPAIAGLLCRREPDGGRVIGMLGIGLMMLVAGWATALTTRENLLVTEAWLGHQGWFILDHLGATTMLVVGVVGLAFFAAAPQADLEEKRSSIVLLGISGAAMAYAADHIVVLWLGVAVSLAPVLNLKSPLALITQAIGLLALLVACAFVIDAGGAIDNSTSLRSLTMAHIDGHGTALFFVVIAAVMRKGLVPFHGWVVSAVERGSMLATLVGVNFHMGAFLLLRMGRALFPAELAAALPIVGDVALVTAVVTALLALVSTRARRQLGLIVVSQSAFVLVGLESANAGGLAGGLITWTVVALATTGLAVSLRAVIERAGELIDQAEPLGLARSAPRLAVFFLVSAVSLIGLPGTMGFCAEDLLLHGVLEDHPSIGAALPIATALNAITLFRLYGHLFLGRRHSIAAAAGDVLPRERFVLTAIVVALIMGGLQPQWVTRFREPTVERFSSSTDEALAATQTQHAADAGLPGALQPSG
jgi:NADH-quinone oxidoreductase subunit M